MLVRSGRKFGCIAQKWLQPPSLYREVSSSSTKGLIVEALDEELQSVIHGNSRKKERMDSVTPAILRDRVRHKNRFALVEPDPDVIKDLSKLGLGSKRKRFNVFSKMTEKQTFQLSMAGSNTVKGGQRTLTAAGGFAKHLTSASSDWPIFDHILPEIAFAGHSNSGKSTLVNAMAGCNASSGPAGVSDRAGWTDQICFYQLGKKPPTFNLADLPGYGHAVARTQQIKQWKLMTRDYLKNREVLSLCCIMVDATRGLCGLDKSLIRFLVATSVPWQVILTKADLLNTVELAQALQVVHTDLTYVIGSRGQPGNPKQLLPIVPVSAGTGAGVQQLYQELEKSAYQSTVTDRDIPAHAVREHCAAYLVRRKAALGKLRAERNKKATGRR